MVIYILLCSSPQQSIPTSVIERSAEALGLFVGNGEHETKSYHFHAHLIIDSTIALNWSIKASNSIWRFRSFIGHCQSQQSVLLPQFGADLERLQSRSIPHQRLVRLRSEDGQGLVGEI